MAEVTAMLARARLLQFPVEQTWPGSQPGSSHTMYDHVYRMLRQVELPVGGAYVFDTDRFETQLDEFLASIGDLPLRLLFPVNVFPVPRVLLLMAARRFGFDVSNIGELSLVCGARPAVLQGPLVATELARRSAPRDIEVVLGTRGQFDVLHACGPVVGLRLRSTDLLGVKDDGPSKFGISTSELGEAVRRVQDSGRRVGTLHVHHGGEDLELAHYVALLKGLVALDRSLGIGATGFALGAGESRAYRTLEGVAKLARVLCSVLATELPEGRSLVMAPGPALFSSCIHLAARVCDVSAREDGCDITVDACFGAALECSESAIVFPYSAPRPRVRILGGSCDESDRLGIFDVPSDHLPRVRVGDPLVVPEVSPYAVGRSHTFNGIPRPQLIFTGGQR